MESSRLDRVRVDVAGEVVEISWHERDMLLQELSFVAGSKTIREKFEAVGASRTVELDGVERSHLRAALAVAQLRQVRAGRRPRSSRSFCRVEPSRRLP